MQTECLDPINEAETGDIPLTELLPGHARSSLRKQPSIENEYFIRRMHLVEWQIGMQF